MFADLSTFQSLRMSPSVASAVKSLQAFVGDKKKKNSDDIPYPFKDVPMFYKSLTERAARKGKHGKPMADEGYHYLSSEAPLLLKSFRVGLNS